VLKQSFIAHSCLKGALVLLAGSSYAQSSPPSPEGLQIIEAPVLAAPPAQPLPTPADSLLLAARRNDTLAVNRLLARGLDVNQPAQTLLEGGYLSDLNEAPLHAAVSAGHLAMVRRLLRAGADANQARGYWPRTALMLAVSTGGGRVPVPGMAQLLLAGGAQVNAQVPTSGKTALHEAIWSIEGGHTSNPAVALPYVQLLVEAGADVNLPDSKGRTPLQDAVQQHWLEVVRYLLAHGARPGRGPESCQGALHLAVADSAMVALLLASGAAPDEGDCEGQQPLHRAQEAGNPAVVAQLLAAGAQARARIQPVDIYAPRRPGATALQLAVSNNKLAAARLLLDAGAEPSALDSSQTTLNTPLLLALYRYQETVRYGSPAGPPVEAAMVDLLLLRGAEIKVADADGTTPLHLAAATGDSALVAQLLARGAEASRPNKEGETPLFYARSPAVLRRLLAAGGRPDTPGSNPLLGRNLNLATVRAAVQAGANPLMPDKNGMTPWHLAAWEGSPEMLQLFLDLGAPLEAPDGRGGTPLSWAVGDTVKVKLLLARGARPTHTALAAAVHSGLYEVVNLLLKRGAPVRDGQALFAAIGALPYELGMMELLLAAGADANARDEHGCSVLQAWLPGACDMHEGAGAGYLTAVTKLLLDHGADPWLRNSKGKNALDIVQAYSYNTPEKRAQVKLLTEYMAAQPQPAPAPSRARR